MPAIQEQLLTIVDVAERLKVNEDTVRKLFMNEPGVGGDLFSA
jgi:hypothetical protein